MLNPKKHQKYIILNLTQAFLNRYRIYQYNILTGYWGTLSGTKWHLNQTNMLHNSDKTKSKTYTQY